MGKFYVWWKVGETAGIRSIASTHFFWIPFRDQIQSHPSIHKFFLKSSKRRTPKTFLDNMFIFTNILPIVFWVGCKKTRVWTRHRRDQTSYSLEIFLKLWPGSGHGSRANFWYCLGADTFLRMTPTSMLLPEGSKFILLSISYWLIHWADSEGRVLASKSLLLEPTV